MRMSPISQFVNHRYTFPSLILCQSDFESSKIKIINQIHNCCHVHKRIRHFRHGLFSQKCQFLFGIFFIPYNFLSKNSYHSIFSSTFCNLRFPKFVLTVLIATDRDQSSTSDQSISFNIELSKSFKKRKIAKTLKYPKFPENCEKQKIVKNSKYLEGGK